MLRAGDLNRRITLRTNSAGRNSFGEQQQNWTDLATVWAGLFNLTTKDVDRQHGLETKAEAKFLIRHREDVTTQAQVVYKDVAYHIVGIEEYQDGEGLLLFVRRTA